MDARIVLSRRGVELTLIYLEGERKFSITITKGQINNTLVFEGEDIYSFVESIDNLFFAYNSSLETRVEKGRIARLRESYNQMSKTRNWTHGKEALATNVFIGLPQEDLELFDIERIQYAVGGFMEAMGYELETRDEPVFGSFFQKLKFKFKRSDKSSETVIIALEKGRIALENQCSNLLVNKAEDELTDAAATLISSLDTVEEAVLQLELLLVVKVSRNGLPAIIIATLSPELAQLIDKNPILLKTPPVLFDMLTTMQSITKKRNDGGAESLIV